MTKIFKYELKRLLLNKFYIGLLVITALYAWQLLGSEIVLGVADTAPFSAWSFGYYLARMLPLLLITLLFFTTYLFSAKEQKVTRLTQVTPVNWFHYGLVRCAAMAAGYVLICLLTMILGQIFYARYFHYVSPAAFIVPACLVLVHPFLLVLGAGLWAGRVHNRILYVLMLLVLVASSLSMPYAVDFFGTNLFSEYPLSLWQGLEEPAFVVPVLAYLLKFIYAATGVVLIVTGLRKRAAEMKP